MIYVLQVKPQEEAKSCVKLNQKGIHAYVPKREMLIHKSGLWTKVINLLFPGYVFMLGEYNAEIFHIVKSVDGVIRFLGSPTPLTESEEKLMLLLFNDGKAIEQSDVYIDSDDNIVGYGGFLNGKEDRIAYINRRQKKASLEIKFGGKIHKANVSIELKKAVTKSE